jgi:hypothetical protein
MVSSSIVSEAITQTSSGQNGADKIESTLNITEIPSFIIGLKEITVFLHLTSILIKAGTISEYFNHFYLIFTINAFPPMSYPSLRRSPFRTVTPFWSK